MELSIALKRHCNGKELEVSTRYESGEIKKKLPRRLVFYNLSAKEAVLFFIQSH
jgi:hypothetical protein